ncbi:MAG: DUF1499 domain-containing protein [Planctomycetaceae bacterium]|nr:DUF1499 domain-containing protein [Planctomycetaceae bacterium]
MSWTSKRPEYLGVHAGRLSPCPDSPNCVCSQDADAAHAITPFAVGHDAERQWTLLQQVIQQQPRVTMVTTTDDYLHAEFRSLVFGFVDDVEFLRDREQGSIHVRSASRVGYSDLGVNRKRIELLRKELAEIMRRDAQ